MCLGVAGTNPDDLRGCDQSARSLDRLRDLGPGPDRYRARWSGCCWSAAPPRTGRSSGWPGWARTPTRLVAPGWPCSGLRTPTRISATSPPARVAARRSLDLCDDDHGPWMRGALSATIAGLAFQTGDLVEAGQYARAALPVLRCSAPTRTTRRPGPSWPCWPCTRADSTTPSGSSTRSRPRTARRPCSAARWS